MGGIVGVFRRDGERADRGLLVRQTERLASRGPDDGAVYVEGPFALGYRRFDAEGRGHQPHWDEEGRVAVAFDGQLDDAEELATLLRRRGHHVLAADGPSVVLAAYREWGDRCAERLSGAFAFVVLDRKANHLLLGRDPLGRQPLYHHLDAHRFCFSSEVDTLLLAAGVPRLLEPAAVATWFRDGFVPEPWTLVRDVRAVPAGAVLLVEADRVRLRQYSAPGGLATGPEGAIAGLRAELEAAVDAALSDDSVILLSGGRVSSALVARARLRQSRVTTFNLPCLDPLDRQESLQLADDLGLDHHEGPTDLDPVEAAREALRVMDLPHAEPAFIGHVAAASALALAQREQRPLLVGHGAAEAVLEPRPPPVDASRALSPGFRSRAGALPAAPTTNGAIQRLASSELRAVDRLAVAAERPVRAPFARLRVIEAALGVSEALDWGRLARGTAPTRVAARAHRRRPPPLDEWMRGDLNELVEALLFQPPGGSSGLLDPARLRWWWYEHQLGLADRSSLVWAAVVFEHWYRRSIERQQVLPERRRRRRRRT